jgi:CheY-like chemotaxis protein
MAPERAARRPTVSYGPLPARFVCLEVSDTDIGMDEETLQHCVEPFYTTKSDQGTGMGLASVYGTVLRHDGRLEIESALGHGTTVRLYLPAARPTDAPAVADGEQPAIPPQRILVADDEPGVRAFLSVALRLDGHTVVEVADGAAALAVLSMRPIDLLITDHGMPGMTGLDLARRVKQRWPRLPVILCTGYSSHLSIEVPLAEVAALLAKPPSLEALRRAVAHALAAR